jgi:fermentation-respiration switch protein FrsA (DUF1100 family)
LARLIADQVPPELDAVSNAAKSRAPCLFVQSEWDGLIPIHYQHLIIQAYAGRKRVFTICQADHHDSIPDEQKRDYEQALQWLRDLL